jgi:hypothetical protein
MEDRDLLLRQLNSFTRAISKLLSDLLKTTTLPFPTILILLILS